MRVTLLVATGIAGLLMLAAGGANRATESGRWPDGSEVVRLRAHFDAVDRELRQADISGLNQAQRASRVQLIAWLREYRNAGEFPVNDRFPDRAMPFFRDSRGVLCAMAWLVASSGRMDLVDRIARTRNNAFIPELADDGELARWLDSTGLTVAEAARIQPSYSQSAGVSGPYAITSLVLSGGTLVAGGFNLVAPTTTSGWLGIGTGLGAGIAGLAKAWEPTNDATRQLAAVNLLAGILGVALGVQGLIRAGRERQPPGTEDSRRQPGIDLSVLPTTMSLGGVPRLGLVVTARF